MNVLHLPYPVMHAPHMLLVHGPKEMPMDMEDMDMAMDGVEPLMTHPGLPMAWAVAVLAAVVAFAVLPVAFAYHLAHNLSHLARESAGFWAVVANPFGVGTEAMTSAERHAHDAAIPFPEPLLFAFQAGLMVWGFWVAAKILRHRGRELSLTGAGILPLSVFAAGMTLFNTWLLTQPMMMRM